MRRPKLITESATLGLDRMELSAFIAQAAASGVMDHALACLLGLLGLRVAEACSINIEDLSTERGHRVVTVMGKGSKLAVIPLPPQVARAVDAAVGPRSSGPLLLSQAGRRMNRPAATRIVRRVAKSAGVTKRISPHSLRHSFITAVFSRRRRLARRPDRGPPLRPSHHHPLRPGPHQPRPSRQLRSHRLHRRRQLNCRRDGLDGTSADARAAASADPTISTVQPGWQRTFLLARRQRPRRNEPLRVGRHLSLAAAVGKRSASLASGTCLGPSRGER